MKLKTHQFHKCFPLQTAGTSLTGLSSRGLEGEFGPLEFRFSSFGVEVGVSFRG